MLENWDPRDIPHWDSLWVSRPFGSLYWDRYHFSQFHSQALQLYLLSTWKKQAPSLDFTRVPVRSSKEFPILVGHHPSPSSEESPSLLEVITTEASLLCWGGVFQTLTVQESGCPERSELRYLSWTETHSLSITVVYISGVDTWKADCLSHHCLGHRE